MKSGRRWHQKESWEAGRSRLGAWGCGKGLTGLRGVQVLERIMDEVSFTADEYAEKEFDISPEYVRERVSSMLVKSDLSKYVL